MNLYEERRKKRHNRLLIMISILAIMLTIGITVLSIYFYIKDTKAERIYYTKGTIDILCDSLDADAITDYLELSEDDPSYQQTKQILQDFADKLDYIEFLYVYKILGEEAIVIFDCDTEELKGDPLGTHVILEADTKPYIKHLINGEAIPPIETHGEDGWLISYGKPLFNSRGKCVAYIYADIAMDDIYINSYKFIIKVVILSIVIMALCIAVGSYISFVYHKRDDFEVMEIQHEQDMLVIKELTEAIAKIIDTKDTYTTGHSARVAMYTAKLTKALGYDDNTVEQYYRVALLHDIGKMGIPKTILNKEGKLTDEEFDIIKSHAIKGYKILKDVSVLPELALGAGYHHERPDGKGYPVEFADQEIPKVAQIIAVADTFDAMYSNRPYRKKMRLEKIITIMQEVKGTQLTEDVVDKLLELIENGEINLQRDNEDDSGENIDNINKTVKYVD